MAKKKEESSRKKKPKVLNVPINLSDQEIGQLRNKILLGLKQELIGGGSNEALADNDVLLPPTLPNPRVEFPRKASSDQNPADLKAQMMKELSRRVSSIDHHLWCQARQRARQTSKCCLHTPRNWL